jgi:Tfp pilus assembly protein PilO
MRLGLRELIFLMVLISLPIAAYFFVFKPRNTQIEESRAEIQSKQSKLEKLQNATRNIDDLGKEIDKLTEAIVVFEQKLPAQREVEVILQQVWEIASKHALTPKSVKTDKPVPAAQYAEIPIYITIVGDFDGFYSFMLELEKLKRITRIPEMTLKKAVKGTDNQMQADFVMSIFFESNGDLNPSSSSGRNRL